MTPEEAEKILGYEVAEEERERARQRGPLTEAQITLLVHLFHPGDEPTTQRVA